MSTDTAEFTLTRQFTLSRDELWHLLTDAKMRENWGAPEEGQTLTLLTEDFRRRGIERHRCGDSGPDAFEVETRWYHINAPTDAVFTESIEAGGQDIATSLVTYRVTDADEGTQLHVTVAVSSFVGPEATADFKAGWEQGLNSLDAFIATRVQA